MNIAHWLPSPSYRIAESSSTLEAIRVLRRPHQSLTNSLIAARLQVIKLIVLTAMDALIHFGAGVAKSAFAVTQLPLVPLYGRVKICESLSQARLHMARSAKLTAAVTGASLLGLALPDRVLHGYQKYGIVEAPTRKTLKELGTRVCCGTAVTASWFSLLLHTGVPSLSDLTPRGWALTGVLWAAGAALGPTIWERLKRSQKLEWLPSPNYRLKASVTTWKAAHLLRNPHQSLIRSMTAEPRQLIKLVAHTAMDVYRLKASATTWETAGLLRNPHQSPFKCAVLARTQLIKLIVLTAMEALIHFSTGIAKCVLAAVQLSRYPLIDRVELRQNLLEARAHIIRSAKLSVAVTGASLLGLALPDRVLHRYQKYGIVEAPTRWSRHGHLVKGAGTVAVVAAANWIATELHNARLFRDNLIHSVWFTCCSVCVLGLAAMTRVAFDSCRPLRALRLRDAYAPIVNRVRGPQLAYSGTTLEVPVAILNERPLEVLSFLRQRLLRDGSIPTINFIETDGRRSAGIDAGGITRTFMTDLPHSIVKQGYIQAGNIASSKTPQLPFFKTDTGEAMPILGPRNRNSRKKIEGFHSLGALLAVCATNNFPTGTLFSLDFYRMILSLSSDELDTVNPDADDIPNQLRRNLQVVQQFKEKALAQMNEFLQMEPGKFTQGDYETLIALAEADINDNEQPPANLETQSNANIVWAKKILKRMALTSRKEDSDVVLPVVLMAKGMQSIVGPDQWNRWTGLGPEGFRTLVQGQSSPEQVLAASVWNRTDLPGGHRTKTWMENWIRGASPKEVEDLLYTITGSRALAPGKTLRFDFYTPGDRNTLPTVHTCTPSIDMPVNYPTNPDGTDDRVFKQKLGQLIAQTTNPSHSGIEMM